LPFSFATIIVLLLPLWHGSGKTNEKIIMRKILMLLVGICIINSAISQKKDATFFIRGGVNLANISTTSSGDIDEAKTLASYHVGAFIDVPLASIVSLQTGLLYTGKGSKTEIYADNNNRSDNYYKIQTNPFYFEIPVNLAFHFPISKRSSVFVGAGPYITMGFAGKTKGEQKLLGVVSSYEKDIEWNHDDPTTSGQEDAGVNKLRRFDYGLNAIAGLKAGKILLGVNYGYGLAKIGSAESNDNDANKHRVLSFTVGIGL
jgi:hypothetical protein